jgi:hypothetical protein
VSGLYDVIGGCRLKFLAMAEHMDRLGEAVDRWLEDQDYVAVLSGETNSHGTKYLFRVQEVVTHPAEEWGIILGDAVHCLRSGLDQLMWGLVEDGKGSDRTQFPICLTEQDWIVNAPAMYWGASPAIVRFLDKVQPYHRGDVNAAREHPLALLSALSNFDKHRAIPAIALVSDQTPETKVIAIQGIEKWSALRFKKGKPYEKDAVVAEAKIVPDNSGLEPHMDMQVEQSFDIGFGVISKAPTLRGKIVYGVFTEIAEYVAKILNLFVDVWNEAVEATHTEEERERARNEARRTYP